MDPEIRRLAELSSAGDSEAFGALCRMTRHTVRAWVAQIVRCQHGVEDVVQESYLGAWKSIRKLRDPQCFIGWLKGLVRNQALLSLRKRKHATLGNLDTAVRDKSGSTNDEIAASDSRDLVHLGISSAKYGHHLAEYYIEGLSIKDIAARHCLPIGTVKRRLFQARRSAGQIKQLQEAYVD